MVKHIPNILTVIRFLLIPFIIIFAIEDNYIATIIILIISCLTDILDRIYC